MKRRKANRNALFTSVISLLLCVSMLVGTTFAWFTDSVVTGINTIAAGNLDVELYHTNAVAKDEKVEPSTDLFRDLQGDPILWEPGVVSYENLRVVNEGDLALAYQMAINTANENYVLDPSGAQYGLSQILKVGVVEDGITATDRAGVVASVAEGSWTTLADFLRNGSLLPEDGENEKTWGIVIYWEPGENDNLWNLNNGKQLSSGEELQIDLGISLIATQEQYESDAFGSDYDSEAKAAVFPEFAGGTADADVAVDGKNLTTAEVTMTSGAVSAVVPAGVKVAAGASKLTLTVTPMDASGANISLGDNEDMRSLDVHIEGVDADNTTPIVVTLKEVAPTGLNMGNYKLYHVENGTTNEMTLVDSAADFTAHNQFKYDPATGDIVLYMATFSEVSLVADTVNAWNGTVATSFAGGSGTETDPYLIANADQLAGFGAMVGGMIGDSKQDFAGKYIKLISDINLGDKDDASTNLFYPIGYYNDAKSYTKPTDGTATAANVTSFQGTFDGNGHTIANFYQNTWQMWGNYDGNYYKAAMGLFGYVVNGTVKNLTVDNFSSDGEYTPTGVIAAYAVNSTFENIAITNCNPRVYNTGNGGIVGIGGSESESTDPENTGLRFNNITIDNTNKITALWGSWDVACGGLVGMFRGPNSVWMNNCHVAAQIDVFNDVCGNYQYYWYRYAGMLVGTNKNMFTDKDGYTVPETSKYHAENCTVHFGDWNDYYYCELVSNSLASYTHDHQFSRLTQIQNVSEIQDANGNWSTSGNFILMNGKTPTEICYHIMKDASGNLYEHKHDVADATNPNVTETVNGETVLKENNQRIFLPFNQLFTGYGWGVKHIPIHKDTDLTETYPNLDITILDREIANSVDKFSAKVDDGYTVSTATEIKIGTLFEAATADVDIVKENVQVFVSPINDSNMILGVYAADAENWENGTLKFHGNGEAKVTITDYTYCNPCSVVVKVVGNSVLYRVGTDGVVNYDQIEYLLTGSKQGSSVEMVKLTDTVYGANFEDKNTDKKVDFTTTGIVGVKVNNVPYFLEVVDAKNITAAENAKDNNVVLLNNITASSIEISNGHSFYGNGFEIKFNGDGSYRNAAVSYGFITMDGGTLDNARVICKIFPKAYLFAKEMSAGSDGRYPYGYSAIIVSGNSTISNSYIYGARNNIQVGAGNIKIQNTVTENGSLSNIHILSESGNTVTLDNLTTIQRQVKDDFGVGNTMLGFGILVGTNETVTYPTIKITGNLKQYNWVSKADASEVSNTYAKEAINSAVTNKQYVHTLDGVDKINLGIVFLTTNTTDIQDNRSDSVKAQVPYLLNDVSISTYKGQVYSVKAGSAITDNSGHNAEKDGVIPYVPNAQNATLPQITHSGVNGSSLTIKTEFNKEWITTFTADLDRIDGGSYTFNFSDLVVKKYGQELAYTIKDASGNPVDKNTPITLNQLQTEEYTLIVTDNLIYNSNGLLSGETVTHEMPFVLYATKTSIEPPKFTGIGAGVNGAIRLVSSSGGNWRPAYPALEGVSVTYWSASQGKMATVDLSTLTNGGTINGQTWTYTCDDYTLTITGGPVHTTTSYVLSPMIATRDGNKILYFAGANKDNSTGTTARLICLEYVFTDKNASTTVGQCTKYAEGIATVQYADLPEFSWSSFQDGKVEEADDPGCVTGDTLITLADGSQKRIDQLTYQDELLVWDFYNGCYTTSVPSVLFNHGDGVYNVVNLNFSDGTSVGVIDEHEFFDIDANSFVNIAYENVSQYLGHKFAKVSSNGITTVTLTGYTYTVEQTGMWTILTAKHLNAIAEGMLSLTPDPTHKCEDFFRLYEVGEEKELEYFN